jgi:orotate phosphoribosyltransferase-like protein
MATNMVTAYLGNVLSTSGLKNTASRAVKILKPHTKKFDTIAFRGLSGALIAPIVALRLNKKMVAIRKGEKAHSYRMAEGDFSGKNYIIIDDLICSGDTLKQIKKSIEESFSEHCCNTPVCVGVILYAQRTPTERFMIPEVVPEVCGVEDFFYLSTLD